MAEREDQSGSAKEWEDTYRNAGPDDLPWDAGGPDPELVGLVESGKMEIGRAIDLGCGPGHDAIYLRRQGFNVTAVDIAPSAIDLARSNAGKAGVGEIDFRVCDAFFLADPPGSFTFVNDRGCFHNLPVGRRSDYVALVRKLLLPRGHLFLRTFSDREPPGPGPCRVSEAEIRSCFVPLFAIMDFKEKEGGARVRHRFNIVLLRKI